MKKLRLSLDALSVESFEARAANGERGTILARDSGETFQDTCQNSCYGTCKWQTCNAPWACP